MQDFAGIRLGPRPSSNPSCSNYLLLFAHTAAAVLLLLPHCFLSRWCSVVAAIFKLQQVDGSCPIGPKISKKATSVDCFFM